MFELIYDQKNPFFRQKMPYISKNLSMDKVYTAENIYFIALVKSVKSLKQLQDLFLFNIIQYVTSIMN